MRNMHNTRYRLNLVTAPASEPIALADVKAHLRIDGSDEDDLLTTLITVSRQAVEAYTKRALITQTWQIFYDRFPDYYYSDCSVSESGNIPVNYYQSYGKARQIELPKAPLQSVTHIKTYANDDTASTFASTNYQVTAYSGVTPTNGRIVLKDGVSFPYFTRNADGIEIQFVAGYGDNASDVPSQIIQAILHLVAYLYENRGDCGCDDISSNMPSAVTMLLNQFKIIRL